MQAHHGGPENVPDASDFAPTAPTRPRTAGPVRLHDAKEATNDSDRIPQLQFLPFPSHIANPARYGDRAA